MIPFCLSATLPFEPFCFICMIKSVYLYTLLKWEKVDDQRYVCIFFSLLGQVIEAFSFAIQLYKGCFPLAFEILQMLLDECFFYGILLQSILCHFHTLIVISILSMTFIKHSFLTDVTEGIKNNDSVLPFCNIAI